VVGHNFVFLSQIFVSAGPLCSPEPDPEQPDAAFSLPTCRFLCIDLLEMMDDGARDALYKFLQAELSRGGCDVARRGGSNGNEDTVDYKTLFRFLHYPGSTPRASYACKWMISGSKLIPIYITPYERKYIAKAHEYSIPILAGQLRWTNARLARGEKQVPGFLQLMLKFTEVKFVSTLVIQGLNRRIDSEGWESLFMHATGYRNKNFAHHNHRPIVPGAVAAELRTIEIVMKHAGGNPIDILLGILQSCFTSFLAAAVGLHNDIAKRNALFRELVEFLEPKVLFLIRCMSTFDPSDPALGRGGAGPGAFIIACTYCISVLVWLVQMVRYYQLTFRYSLQCWTIASKKKQGWHTANSGSATTSKFRCRPSWMPGGRPMPTLVLHLLQELARQLSTITIPLPSRMP